jgi:hypothetical protein
MRGKQREKILAESNAEELNSRRKLGDVALERVSDRCSVDGVGETNWARRTKQTNPRIRRWSSTKHNAVAASQNATDKRNAL